MNAAHLEADTDIKRSSILRRYMDLAKLLDLLTTNTLYCRRADGFSDRLEGALFPGFRTSLDQAFDRGEVPNDANYFYRRSRLGNYVSCWTLGARDNMALWHLYGGAKTSIAVTTTVDRLIRCALEWKRPTILHKVRYVDHRRVSTYIMGRYTDVLKYKSDAYKYEREIRLLIPQQDDGWEANPISIRLPLSSLDALVRSIVIAPEADSSFVEHVRELCKRYELKAPVRRSTLSLIPV